MLRNISYLKSDTTWLRCLNSQLKRKSESSLAAVLSSPVINDGGCDIFAMTNIHAGRETTLKESETYGDPNEGYNVGVRLPELPIDVRGDLFGIFCWCRACAANAGKGYWFESTVLYVYHTFFVSYFLYWFLILICIR